MVAENSREDDNQHLNPDDGYPTTRELFDDFLDFGVEGKLELIDSRLIVGNSIVGSRLLLRHILQGWGASAGVALAPLEKWVLAIAAAFGVTNFQPTNNIIESLNNLQSIVISASKSYQPENLAAGYRGEENNHNAIRQHISSGLWQVAELLGGNCFSRDFVMRLGNNGLTPDVLFFTGKHHNQLHSWYLNGPAELVIEILRPGHEYSDRILKRDIYAASGVPEYWLIDPKTQQTEFLGLTDGVYQVRSLDGDNCYRPSSIPGLVFHPEQLWCEEDWYRGRLHQTLFTLEVPEQPFRKIPSIDDGLGWGRLAFNPNLQLEPTTVSFEQYICWSPEAKFEFWDGKPQIGGKAGIRNLLGMLLMTFGLTSSIRVLPPKAWISAIEERFLLEQQDDKRKAQWWELARQAANLLRSNYDIKRIAVIGDLVRPTPLNYWSDITLVVWDVPDMKGYEIYKALSSLSKQPKIRLIEADEEYLTVEEENAIAREFVNI